MSIKYSVDNLIINENKKGTTILINGWCVSLDGVIPDRTLFINGEKTECSDVPWGRGDAVSALKLSDDLVMCGFAICVRDYKEKVNTLSIVAETPTESRKILDLSEKLTAQMKERHSFICKLESVNYDKNTGSFELAGWTMKDPDQEIHYGILEDNGSFKELPYRKIVRDDLVGMNFIDKNDKICGFFVSVPAVKSDKFIFSVRSGKDEKKYQVKSHGFKKSITTIRSLIRNTSPETIRKAFRYLHRYGFSKTIIRMTQGYDPASVYDFWFRDHRVTEETLDLQRKQVFEYNPKISLLVPTYNTPIDLLKEMIETVLNQSYGNWELCIADGSSPENKAREMIRTYSEQDSRIKVTYLDRNYGISGNTNKALELATGDYIAPYDHDDFLELDALYEIVKVLNHHRYDVIYTDEDKFDMTRKTFEDPNLKPDFSIDLLRSHNYITHLFVVRADIMRSTGGFHQEYDGSQDYDMILRCIEKAESIYHLPKIIYHWRMHSGSTAADPESKMYCYEAGQRAIQDHLDRIGLPAKVTMIGKPHYGLYHVKYETPGNPLVSILIPNYENKDVLKKCIDSLYKKNNYQNFEVVIVENNSKSDEIFSYYDELQKAHDNLRVVTWKGAEFNYSAINNFGVRYVKGEYILFLNNDTEVISPDAIREMLGCCMREEVGAVGAKLLYKDNTVQHAGVVIGVDDVAAHVFRGIGADAEGYMMRPLINCDYSAVTAACMMTKKSIFEQVGGFEEDLKVAFNDIDYCLKVRELDKLIVYNAFSLWHHYESVSRGYETSPEKAERFQREIRYFKNKWKRIYEEGDPFYNRNFNVNYPPFTIHS